jgi:hypothetical protein
MVFSSCSGSCQATENWVTASGETDVRLIATHKGIFFFFQSCRASFYGHFGVFVCFIC